MASKSKPRLFPLLLTPFETFMCCDGSAAYPMTFVMQLDFAGQVDRQVFQAVLAEALIRHPLLGAVIKPAKHNMPCWVPADGTGPLVDWADANCPIELSQGEPIDLTSDVGLRLWCRQGDDRARITIQMHHACCDGIGAFRFVGDLLALYGARTASRGAQPALGPIDAQCLRRRGMEVLRVARSGSRRQLSWLAVQQATQILGPRIALLAAPTATDRRRFQPGSFPGIESFSFDRAQHQQIRLAAAALGVTVNDLLLHELFHTMHEWNRQQRRWPGGRIRILMPTDMRNQDHYEMPAANLTSYTFITRRTSTCRAPQKLLRSIRQETALIKHHHRGTLFMDALAGAVNVRGLLPLLCSAARCMATAILSNIGDPSRRFTATFPREAGRVVCGNLVLEGITGVPPLRCRTRLGIGIYTYLRKLTISLRCDPYLFAPYHAQQLLALYTDRLRQYLKVSEA